MTTRKTPGNARRDDPKPRPGKGGGLMTGLFIGLVVGLVVAAGLAWYFSDRAATLRPAEETRHTQVEPRSTAESSPAETSVPQSPEFAAKPTPDPTPPTAAQGASGTTKPRVDYTFYGILPGDKPAKPIPPPQSKDIWWLQVAALKNPADADKLKARLSLLGLEVAMQKVDSDGAALYRIRVGPYKREDDALGDLDTLAANDFEPRLFKEPNTHSNAPKIQEKP